MLLAWFWNRVFPLGSPFGRSFGRWFDVRLCFTILLCAFSAVDLPVFCASGKNALSFGGIEDPLNFMYWMISSNRCWDWLYKGVS